jgi:hypothetical protein
MVLSFCNYMILVTVQYIKNIYYMYWHNALYNKSPLTSQYNV